MVAIFDFRVEQVIILIFLEKATLLYGVVIVTAIFHSKSNGILYILKSSPPDSLHMKTCS